MKIITFEELKKNPYLFTHELAGSYGNGNNKTLQITVSIPSEAVTYQVLHEHKEILDTGLLKIAIDTFNELS